jgi:hypothetical protein
MKEIESPRQGGSRPNGAAVSEAQKFAGVLAPDLSAMRGAGALIPNPDRRAIRLPRQEQKGNILWSQR